MRWTAADWLQGHRITALSSFHALFCPTFGLIYIYLPVFPNGPIYPSTHCPCIASEVWTIPPCFLDFPGPGLLFRLPGALKPPSDRYLPCHIGKGRSGRGTFDGSFGLLLHVHILGHLLKSTETARGKYSYSCTKGHRSSKCTHYDRILYKVRKPGRPLNNCPHILPDSIPPGTFVNTSAESMANGQPPKEACNCRNDLVQVAIPKGV